jgi:dynein heavy chain
MMWFEDLMLRIMQLDEYSEELIAPISLWISGLFNPMSYLTAIMQTTSRATGIPLDNMVLKTDVLNIKDPKEIQESAEVGAYIHGFFLEGAGWELGRGHDQGNLCDMILKELHPELPVVHVTSIDRKEQVTEGFYLCPAYSTTLRGGTFVFQCYLKMESEESDANLWVLAGVCLLMAPE